jgi:hypothetical protein
MLIPTSLSIGRAQRWLGPVLSLLLLALGVSLVRMLVSGLRMLLRSIGVLFTLGMVTFAMMFGSRAMGLGRVFVMFSSLIVFVFSHLLPRWLFDPSPHQIHPR